MQKKYIVRLSRRERDTLQQIVKKLKGSSQKVRRAQILLKADVNGGDWTDSHIAEAFGCRTQTVEVIRQRFVERGFQETLEGKKRSAPPTEKLLDGEQEARSSPLVSGRRRRATPTGRSGCWLGRSWNWRLWRRSAMKRCGEHLKKRDDESQDPVLGDSARGRCRVRGKHGRSAGNLRQTV